MAGLRGRALIAYILVCTVWGSTYLAIRVGVMHLPPLLFAGIRFVIAGLLLAGIMLAAGDRLPRTSRDWKVLAITGLFLLLGGNAVVVWAEQHVESGAASVFVAAVPLWAAFFDALWPGGTTVFSWRVGVGLALGFLGSALLAGVTPGELMNADLAGPVALTLASASWALGTVYSKRNPTDTSPYVASAVQMLAGGAVITLLGLFAFLLVQALTRLSAKYDELSNVVQPRRQAPWMRSMRGDRPGDLIARPSTAAEKVVIGAVLLAILCFEVWFFFFSGSSIGGAGGRG